MKLPISNATNTSTMVVALVIDDEYIHAERHCYVLKEAGVVMCSFGCSSDDALSSITLETLRPAIVILDLRLSDGDDQADRSGFSLLAKMRLLAKEQLWPLPFCIFVTGYGDAGTRARISETPGSLFLEKPVSDQELIRAFSEAVAALPAWQAASKPSWTEKLERERLELIEEEFRMGGNLPERSRSRLEELQRCHGEWLIETHPIDFSAVESALDSLRRDPPADQTPND
jgi:FixJ family two-component response regulator